MVVTNEPAPGQADAAAIAVDALALMAGLDPKVNAGSDKNATMIFFGAARKNTGPLDSFQLP